MDWIPLIAEVGFPILVTFYLLTRIESKLEHLTFSIQLLSDQLGHIYTETGRHEGFSKEKMNGTT